MLTDALPHDSTLEQLLAQAPDDLKGAVLVTGSQEEEVFTLLNEQRVWNKITAFAADPVAARKRLTSRSTRYSGVLDMLSIEEGDSSDLGLLEVREGGSGRGFGCMLMSRSIQGARPGPLTDSMSATPNNSRSSRTTSTTRGWTCRRTPTLSACSRRRSSSRAAVRACLCWGGGGGFRTMSRRYPPIHALCFDPPQPQG